MTTVTRHAAQLSDSLAERIRSLGLAHHAANIESTQVHPGIGEACSQLRSCCKGAWTGASGGLHGLGAERGMCQKGDRDGGQGWRRRHSPEMRKLG